MAGEHDPKGASPRNPDTPHESKWALKKNGAHNPKGASTAENGAARTTKSVRTTGEHDPKGASPRKPDTPHESKWARKKNGAHNPKGASTAETGAARTNKSVRTTGEHDPKGASPRIPDTPHKSKWALEKQGAHNPKGASNPKHGAARTTKSVRTTGEHDPKGASPTNHDTPRESKWALKKTRGAQPEGCVNGRKRSGTHNQQHAHDRAARPKGCFTHKLDAQHQRNWAQRKTGRTTRRVRQTRNTGRRAQPTACARRLSTTQRVLHPKTPTRRTRASGR